MKNVGSVGKQNELALLSSSSEKQRQAGSGVKAAGAVLVSVTWVDLSGLECLPHLLGSEVWLFSVHLAEVVVLDPQQKLHTHTHVLIHTHLHTCTHTCILTHTHTNEHVMKLMIFF